MEAIRPISATTPPLPPAPPPGICTSGHWSIWNEPDAESHWEGGGAEFARLLKATGLRSIRAANPEAKVLPGGVTGSPALAERFYRELQQAGARPDFDIYEYHYRNISLHRRLLRGVRLAGYAALEHGSRRRRGESGAAGA